MSMMFPHIVGRTGRERAVQLVRALGPASCRCPGHSTTASSAVSPDDHASTTDYAFEMATSTVRYGPGVTREVGLDIRHLTKAVSGGGRVCVLTDPTLARLPPVAAVLESLDRAGARYDLFPRVRVEPTDESVMEAVRFAFAGQYSAFVAVGGGSVIDTAKVARLMLAHPERELMDFVVRPIGKGMLVTGSLKPLVAVPTTAGTGSETTGVAIFDVKSMGAKVGIGNRALKPTLGVIDPLHTLHMPERVAANTAYDVLCHALESFTALPYSERAPRPATPQERPAYQGSNPVSDVWSRHALRIFAQFARRAIFDAGDLEARSQLHLASMMAGVGFGNAGVHLCHAMSYPISSQVPADRSPPSGYETVGHSIAPHGASVVVTAPAVFEFTAPACPDRHLEAAAILSGDPSGQSEMRRNREDAGRVLGDVLRGIMSDTKVENGIGAFGFSGESIDALVKGTLPQERVTKLAPRPQTADDLAGIFERSIKAY